MQNLGLESLGIGSKIKLTTYPYMLPVALPGGGGGGGWGCIWIHMHPDPTPMHPLYEHFGCLPSPKSIDQP